MTLIKRQTYRLPLTLPKKLKEKVIEASERRGLACAAFVRLVLLDFFEKEANKEVTK
jgi:hypothetical protein